MSRDELADVLHCHRLPYGGLAGLTIMLDATAAHAAADRILAAGYRKPRTITTAEELDGLAEGAVVLADGYRHHANGMPIAFQRWSDGDWHRGARSGNTHPDNIVPATVLYEPTQ